MGKIVHVSRMTIRQEPDRIRRAYLAGFEEPIVFGLHGGVKEHYGAEPKEERPTTIDHLVAALAG
jgi:hypothetical protein